MIRTVSEFALNELRPILHNLPETVEEFAQHLENSFMPFATKATREIYVEAFKQLKGL